MPCSFFSIFISLDVFHSTIDPIKYKFSPSYSALNVTLPSSLISGLFNSDSPSTEINALEVKSPSSECLGFNGSPCQSPNSWLLVSGDQVTIPYS